MKNQGEKKERVRKKGSCKESNERQKWGKKKKSREREVEVGEERKERNKGKNGRGYIGKKAVAETEKRGRLGKERKRRE